MEGKVLAHVNVVAGMKAGAPLADDDIARFGALTSEEFDAQSFAVTVPAVVGTTYAFLMCHDTILFSVNKWGRLAGDGINLDPGKGLAVSVFHLIPLASFLFEDDHFIAFDVIQNGGFYLCF